LWRWITEGVRLPDGSRVRLEAARLGGRWLTSEPALRRFLAAQTPELGASPPRTAAHAWKAAQGRREGRRRAGEGRRLRRKAEPPAV
jgi:hypothetical protein